MEDSADTRIVVIEIDIDNEPVLVGVTADKVYEVTEISRAHMQRRRASACTGIRSSFASSPNGVKSSSLFPTWNGS
jgi:hypothetical protein